MDFPDFIRERLAALRRANRFRELSLPAGDAFADNDYLGLSRHPEVLAAGREAIGRFGAGSRGSRLLGGHSALFEEAEERIARAFSAPAALFFSTGYLANLAVVQALGGLAGEILSDEKNHASLIDGIRLSGASKRVVPHNRWDEVDPASIARPALLVTESLFSMDGDPCDRDALEALWRRLPGSFLLVDEAHAAGVIGDSGRGLFGDAGWNDADWERGARTLTFGKAFGAAGAAVLCSRTVKDWLVNAARSFVYTTAPAPAVVAMAVKGMEIALSARELREELWDRARMVRDRLGGAEGPWGRPLPRAAGTWGERSPIIPFHVPGDGNVLRFCQNMGQLGFGLKAIRYPTVPVGTERLRISLSLAVPRDRTARMTEEVLTRWKAFLSPEPIPE